MRSPDGRVWLLPAVRDDRRRQMHLTALSAILDPTPTSEGCRSLSTVPEELDMTIGAPEDQT
jgi:hypothetical protein